MSLRSHRLEALLGAKFEDLEYSHFIALELNQDSIESDDIDWKIQYSGDKASFERAKDVAALANKSGGILALGVAQDKVTSKIQKVVDHPITDIAEREVHQALAANIFPLPDYAIRRLPNPDKDGTEGILLVGVSASARRPHAVLTEQRPTFAYPQRIGNKTEWLAEPEIATMYRNRFAGSAERENRVDEIEFDSIRSFEHGGQYGPILTVSLVPEVAGSFKINRAALKQFEESAPSHPPIGQNLQTTMERVTVGSSRLQLTDASPGATRRPSIHCEFHSDGSGTWGVVPRTHSFRGSTEDSIGYVPTDYLSLQVLNALLLLSQHATENAGTSGTALVRVSLRGSIYDHHQIFRDMSASPEFDYLRLGKWDPSGRSRFQPQGERLSSYAEANSVCVLDSMNSIGPGLLQAAAFATRGVMQEFGLIENPQFSENGTFNAYEFPHSEEREWNLWCESHGISFRRS